MRILNLAEFIAEIESCEKDMIDRSIVRVFLNMEAKKSKWAYIVKLLLNAKGILTKQYLVKKLKTLKKLMKDDMGFQILDIEGKIVYFMKYPNDKIRFLRGE